MEGGIGVPFIARWPGKIPAGKIDQTNILSAVDLVPTFCELAEIDLPSDYRPDGVSQVDALKGEKLETRKKPLFWRMTQNRLSYAIVHENWKLVANKDFSKCELYDLVADPLEKLELSKAQPQVVEKLVQSIRDWIQTLPTSPSGPVFSSLRADPVP